MLHLPIMLFLVRMTPTILLFNNNIQNEGFSINKDISLMILNGLYPSLKVCIRIPSLTMCHNKSDKRRIHYMKLIKCFDERTQYVLEPIANAYCGIKITTSRDKRHRMLDDITSLNIYIV
eukprot:12431_1